MIIKNLKVLCVVKQGDIYTRVVRQDAIEDFSEDFGSMTVASANTPELRMSDQTLFVRGDHIYSHHIPHRLYSSGEKTDNAIYYLNELNLKLKEICTPSNY